MLYARVYKSIIDKLLAALLIVVMSPVIAALAIGVRLFMGSPVLFRQLRAGQHGIAFTFLKFTTMIDARDANGNPLPDELRLTRFGRFLRASSLDELPQLWNVLKGDMSLIGPRPLLAEYIPRYNDFQRRRHDLKPGITGWAQVKGRNSLTWDQKFALDVWYVDHCGFALDVRIIWKTLTCTLRRKGINEEGQATARPFAGTSSA